MEVPSIDCVDTTVPVVPGVGAVVVVVLAAMGVGG